MVTSKTNSDGIPEAGLEGSWDEHKIYLFDLKRPLAMPLRNERICQLKKSAVAVL